MSAYCVVVTSASPCKKDDFHKERSRFLDAFARLEEALQAKPLDASNEEAIEMLKSLRTIRNDIVHSQLRVANMDGSLHAIFINSQDASKAVKTARVLALNDLKSLAAQIGELRKTGA